MITVMVLMCHLLAGLTEPVCHEVVVARLEMSKMACQVSAQAGVAQWKATSLYRGDNWIVREIGCMPGDYQAKDAI